MVTYLSARQNSPGGQGSDLLPTHKLWYFAFSLLQMLPELYTVTAFAASQRDAWLIIISSVGQLQQDLTFLLSMKDTTALHFLAGGAVGAVIAATALQYLRRRDWNSSSRQYDSLEQKEHRSTLESQATPDMGNFLDDEVLKEQFTRNVQFFGEQGQLKVANASVIVIGLGVSVHRLPCIDCNNPHHLLQFWSAGCWQPCCSHVAEVRSWKTQAHRL